MTSKQVKALRSICERYEVEYDSKHFPESGRLMGLPEGYVSGWVGGVPNCNIYIGCSPEGELSS